jgi:hypothetical protein
MVGMAIKVYNTMKNFVRNYQKEVKVTNEVLEKQNQFSKLIKILEK